MRKTTHGWTVVHSLYDISVTFPTSHAERSPLNCSAVLNADDGERGHRERRRRRRRDECECGIRNGKERDGGDMRKTTHGWTVVHSLDAIVVTFPTSHAERSPLNLSLIHISEPTRPY